MKLEPNCFYMVEPQSSNGYKYIFVTDNTGELELDLYVREPKALVWKAMKDQGWINVASEMIYFRITRMWLSKELMMEDMFVEML